MESLSLAIMHFILKFNKSSQWEINQQTFMLQPEISGVICIKDNISEKTHSWLHFYKVEMTSKAKEMLQGQIYLKENSYSQYLNMETSL